eukprot:9563909-Heterocapsa_arctica.AAC.1
MEDPLIDTFLQPPPTRPANSHEAQSMLTLALAGIFKDSLLAPVLNTRAEQLAYLKEMESRLQRHSEALMPHFFALLKEDWTYGQLTDLLVPDS